MGKRGPKKTPTATLKIRGSEVANERWNEPQPKGSIGGCPDWLNEHGKDKWGELIGVLQPLGLATEADRDALAGYCEAWQDFRDAMEAVAEYGAEIVGSKGNLVANPAVHRKQAAWARLNKLAGEFGLTPAARAGLHAVPQSTGADKSKFFKNRA